jgi:hypothetical protein
MRARALYSSLPNLLLRRRETLFADASRWQQMRLSPLALFRRPGPRIVIVAEICYTLCYTPRVVTARNHHPLRLRRRAPLCLCLLPPRGSVWCHPHPTPLRTHITCHSLVWYLQHITCHHMSPRGHQGVNAPPACHHCCLATLRPSKTCSFWGLPLHRLRTRTLRCWWATHLSRSSETTAVAWPTVQDTSASRELSACCEALQWEAVCPPGTFCRER